MKEKITFSLGVRLGSDTIMSFLSLVPKKVSQSQELQAGKKGKN